VLPDSQRSEQQLFIAFLHVCLQCYYVNGYIVWRINVAWSAQNENCRYDLCTCACWLMGFGHARTRTFTVRIWVILYSVILCIPMYVQARRHGYGHCRAMANKGFSHITIRTIQVNLNFAVFCERTSDIDQDLYNLLFTAFHTCSFTYLQSGMSGVRNYVKKIRLF